MWRYRLVVRTPDSQSGNRGSTPRSAIVRKNKTLLVCFITAFIFLTLPIFAQAADYYVSTSGDDSNPGTQSQPWETIQKAADTMVGGDTVYIRAGTYNERVALNYKGNSSGPYITFTNYSDEEVILDGTGISIQWGGGLFHVWHTDYIRVQGLKIQNSNGAGIYVAYADNIEVIDNQTDITTKSGVGIWASSNVLVANNDIAHMCGVGDQFIAGCSEENISIAQGSHDVVVRDNHVHDGPVVPGGYAGAEGINVKDGSYDIKIYNNVVHDLQKLAFGLDAWQNHTYNIEYYNNIAYNCSYGFIVSSEQGGTVENVKVYNNIAYNITRAGFSTVWWSGTVDAMKTDIQFINNTSYNNGYGFWNRSPLNENVIVRNNIFSQNETNVLLLSGSEDQFTVDNNLFYGSGGTYGTNMIIGDPLFVNSTGADFHLQSGSPAIDAGVTLSDVTDDYEGNSRPQGSGYDIGAYEYIGVSGPKTYYVSVTGSDSNPGTQSQPWRTIQKAADIMTAGDTVYVNAGTYNERVAMHSSGNSGAMISFIANGTVKMHGFSIYADYIRVKGLNITSVASGWTTIAYGIYIHGDYCIVEDNYIYYCPNSGIATGAASSGCTIRNNKLQRNTLAGMEIDGTNHIIENNEIWDTIVYHNPTQSMLTQDSNGAFFHGSGHIFRSNYIHDINFTNPESRDYHPHIDAFQTWYGASNILFEKNLIVMPEYVDETGNSLAGWMLAGADNITIKNNIVVTHRGTETGGGGCSNLNILNNVFVGSLDYPADSGWPGGIMLENAPYSTVRNNIIYNQVNQSIYLVGSTFTDLDIGNNLTYRSNGTTPSAYTYTTQSSDLWGVDPRFVNSSTRDYSLQSDSPAIDAGATLSEVTDDYDGNSRPKGSAYDIGAYEYTGIESKPKPTPSPSPTPSPTPSPSPTPTPSPSPTPSSSQQQTQQQQQQTTSQYQEGSLLRAKGDFKVYIIKGNYKRHIFNPAIFNMYRHFSWNSIIEVTKEVIDSYITSDLYRALNDYRVYSLEEKDEINGIAIKHHINMTPIQFTTKGYSWSQIFIVNPEERDYYQTGADLVP